MLLLLFLYIFQEKKTQDLSVCLIQTIYGNQLSVTEGLRNSSYILYIIFQKVIIKQYNNQTHNNNNTAVKMKKKTKCKKIRKRVPRTGEGVLNWMIKKIPFEMHISGYQYCMCQKKNKCVLNFS